MRRSWSASLVDRSAPASSPPSGRRGCRRSRRCATSRSTAPAPSRGAARRRRRPSSPSAWPSRSSARVGGDAGARRSPGSARCSPSSGRRPRPGRRPAGGARARRARCAGSAGVTGVAGPRERHAQPAAHRRHRVGADGRRRRGHAVHRVRGVDQGVDRRRRRRGRSPATSSSPPGAFGGGGLEPAAGRRPSPPCPRWTPPPGSAGARLASTGRTETVTVADPAALDPGARSRRDRRRARRPRRRRRSPCRARRPSDHGWRSATPVPVTFADGTTADLHASAPSTTSDDLAGDVRRAPRRVGARTPCRTSTAPCCVGLADGVSLDDGDGRGRARSPPASATRTCRTGPSTSTTSTSRRRHRARPRLRAAGARRSSSPCMGIANTLSLSIHERTRELGPAAGGRRRPGASCGRWCGGSR